MQQLHLEVAKDAHLELNVPFPKTLQANSACTLNISKIDLQRVLPFTYDTLHVPPLVAVAVEEVQAGEQVGTLPLDSLYTAALNVLMPQLESQKMLTSNYITVNVANIMSEFLPYPPSLDLTCLFPQTLDSLNSWPNLMAPHTARDI